jgi:hypothetical protein
MFLTTPPGILYFKITFEDRITTSRETHRKVPKKSPVPNIDLFSVNERLNFVYQGASLMDANPQHFDLLEIKVTELLKGGWPSIIRKPDT